MVKIAIMVLVGLLLVGGLSLSYDKSHETENDSEDIYQGSVPVGYDIKHFRQTGYTIKEVFS